MAEVSLTRTAHRPLLSSVDSPNSETPVVSTTATSTRTGGGGEALPTLSGGELLLRLVQNPLQTPSSLSPLPPPSVQPYGVSLDPAVAAFGPTIPLPNNGQHYSAPSEASFFHGFPHNNPSWPGQPSPSLLNATSLVQLNDFQDQRGHEQSKLMLGKMPFNAVLHGGASCNPQREVNGLHPRWGLNTPPNSGVRTNDRVYNSPEIRHQRAPPPGFSGLPARPRTGNKGFEHNLFKGPTSSTGLRLNQRSVGETERSRVMELGHQLHHPGLPDGSKLHSVSALEIEEYMSNAHAHANGKQDDNKLKNDSLDGKGQDDEIAEFSQQFGESLVVEDEHDEKSQKKKHRDKDFRSDPRGNHTLSQRMRNMKSYIQCRSDISRFNSRFLEIYESLIPVEEEKVKQKKLLALLEKLVCKEWPNSRLCLYGSCANSFGVSKSDIDICLDIADQNVDKSEVLLKLADILQSDNLENVQALTRARVPIVKLKEPVTGISCDICINNVLAVVNTKLLRDYAEIDVRLRHLAFIVKHWAKSRAVNETYQGTLSSYAYVLMCIHFLQQRRPAILPCLQEMDATYTVIVDGVKYCYFDEVERLRNFGAQNKESLAQLVWAFFNYWAYCHDYANSVISVRTGSFISKQEKDWTRRIGYERHLICIEDPFETSHDLGRVVYKHSIRVLREEFERAASLLQYDPNPCVELFTPYVPS